jgi:iron(III) transport system ATP-binding protein
VTAPILSVRQVSKRFGTHNALVEVCLDVAAGESVVVLGPSGCGKTTLLRVISGLEVPDAGEISLGGTLVAAAGRNIIAPHKRGVGFVFQDLALWPHLTVRQNLDFVLASAGMPGQERAARALEALTLVRVEELSGRYPHQLSGGEQQRVALARALAAHPHLLLLDEPLSSLDPDLRVSLRAELFALQRRLRITGIHVTHDREDALALSDRTIEMRAGRIVAERAGGGQKHVS